MLKSSDRSEDRACNGRRSDGHESIPALHTHNHNHVIEHKGRDSKVMTRNYLRDEYSDEELKEVLLNYLNQGYTVKQIADAIGSTERSVTRWKSEFGLTIKPLTLTIVDVVSDHEAGMSANDMAKKYNVSIESVTRRLKKGGVVVSRANGIKRKNQQRHDALWPEIEFDMNSGYLKSELVSKYKISAPSLNALLNRHNYSPTFVGDVSDVQTLLDDASLIGNAKKRRSTIEYLSAIVEYVDLFQVRPSMSDLARFMNKSIQTVNSWFLTNDKNHLLSQGLTVSYNVRLICRHLTDLGVEFELNNRKLIAPFEIDIWIPGCNLGIEVNPTTTHSVAKRVGLRAVPREYHQMKSLMCFDEGIKLVHIYDWDDISIEAIRNLLVADKTVDLNANPLVLDLNKLLVTKNDLLAYNIHQCSVVEPIEYLVNRNSSKITDVVDRNTISVFDAGKVVCVRNA